METITKQTTDELIDIVILFVDDKPKGILTERELLTFRGNIWWDYIERYSISRSDYESRDIQSIVWKYHKK